MDYGPIAHYGTCLDNQFSTSENGHDESKTFRKGPISQERWGEDDGSAPQALARLVHLATGIWLCLSPWILPFGLDPTATQATVIFGLLIIVAEVVTLSAFRAWEEWISVILGIWLIISPWAMGIGVSVARVNLVVVGLLVIALAMYEFWQARAQ